MLDVDGAELAVAPFAEVGGGFGDAEAVGDGGGEEVVPVGVGFGKPAGGSVHDEPLFGVGFVAPGIEGGGGDGLVFAFGLSGDWAVDLVGAVTCGLMSSGQSAARAATTMAGAAALASTLPFQSRRRSAAWWRRLSLLTCVSSGLVA